MLDCCCAGRLYLQVVPMSTHLNSGRDLIAALAAWSRPLIQSVQQCVVSITGPLAGCFELLSFDSDCMCHVLRCKA